MMCVCMHAVVGSTGTSIHRAVYMQWVRVGCEVLCSHGWWLDRFCFPPWWFTELYSLHETLIDISINCLFGSAKHWAK